MGGTISPYDTQEEINKAANTIPPVKVQPTPTVNPMQSALTTRSSALGNTNASNGYMGVMNGIDQSQYTVGPDGRYSPVENANLSAGELASLDVYNNTLDTDWGGMLGMVGGVADTVMGIGSYFDTQKTNKLQREGLRNNIATQQESRQQKRDFLSSARSAFAPKA